MVGYDVLREHQMPVAHLAISVWRLPHVRGCEIQQRLSARDGSAPHCRVASKFTRCARQYFDSIDLPVELVHLSGSVELGPITGIAEAIVDLVATGRTLKDNGLVAIEDLFHTTARLVGHPCPCASIRESFSRSSRPWMRQGPLR